MEPCAEWNVGFRTFAGRLAQRALGVPPSGGWETGGSVNVNRASASASVAPLHCTHVSRLMRSCVRVSVGVCKRLLRRLLQRARRRRGRRRRSRTAKARRLSRRRKRKRRRMRDAPATTVSCTWARAGRGRRCTRTCCAPSAGRSTCAAASAGCSSRPGRYLSRRRRCPSYRTVLMSNMDPSLDEPYII